MKKGYDNALQLMYQGNDMLAMIIKSFVNSFPLALEEKINAGKNKGTVIKDDKRWVYIDTGNSFNISIGSHKNSSKDYFNLYLANISDEMLRSWPKYDGEKMVGYVTIYLYGDKKTREKPMQVNYDFNIKRSGNKLVLLISTNFNAAFKDNAEKLDKYGLSEIHQNVVGNYYVIDANDILKNKR